MSQDQGDPAPQTDGHVLHWAGLYDGMVGLISLGRERELRSQTIALANLEPGQRVLDVGCGTGTLAIAAARAAPEVVVHGIDPAPEMVDRARRKASAAGVAATFAVGVIEQLTAEADSFDVVLSSLMLHHLPAGTRRTGLAEVLRVLKPGGRLVAVDFSGPGPVLHRLLRWLPGGRSRAQRHANELMEQVRTAGFDDLVRRQLRPRFLFSLVARKPR